MPKPFSIKETIDTVVTRGEGATRRPLPVTAVRKYIDAIKEAYEVANLDPERTDRPEPYCPGAYDAYCSVLQVGYAKNPETSYERGLFIARVSTGSIALHGTVEARDGQFRGSEATFFDTDRGSLDQPTAVELTKGDKGSLAPITDMITMYVQSAEFRPWVPESGIASLHRIRAGESSATII